MSLGALIATVAICVGADEPKIVRLTTDGHFKQRPAWSPDGSWLAFTRHQGATIFLFLRSADGSQEKRLTMRKEPEFDAVWSPDGRELFYNPRPQGLEVVSVTTAPTFAFGNSSPVPRPFQLTPPEQRRAYDITPDGKFVARVTPTGTLPDVSNTPEMRVVLNWFEELRSRVPPGR
jgi:dipeptidyl aminopeptidase/acylaminoacyl peptidase